MSVLTTNFPLEVKHFIDGITYNDTDWLNKEQRIILDVYNKIVKRGMLAYWLPGSGKTHLAAAIALSSNRPVIYITNKSLMADFNSKVETIKKQLLERNIDPQRLKEFKFLSLNASNLRKQLDNATFDGSLDGCMVIIDEAHHFFNSITNNSANASDLYVRIKKAKDIRLFFMTGTPIVKNPFELVPCVNMLAGFELLPENPDDFRKLFFDEHGIQRVGKLENRLMGLISYYEIPKEEAKRRLPKELPEVRVEVEMSEYQHQKYMIARDKEIEETSFQVQAAQRIGKFQKRENTSTYRIVSRQLSNIAPPKHAFEEVKEKKVDIDEDPLDTMGEKDALVLPLSDPKKGGKKSKNEWDGSTEWRGGILPSHYKTSDSSKDYNTMGNLKILWDAISGGEGETLVIDPFECQLNNSKLSKGGLDRLESGGKPVKMAFNPQLLTDADCKNILEYSPKLAALLKNVARHADRVQYIYSVFKAYGIGVVARLLEYMGYLDYAKHGPGPKRFAMIHGDIPIDERTKRVALYNEDYLGSKIAILLITVTASEGFDFKCSGACHVLEYFFHEAIIEQITKRGNRLDSHLTMPEGDRTFVVYKYFSSIPKEYQEAHPNDSENLSTDLHLYKMAQERSQKINQILSVMKRVSLHGMEGCKVCSPTGKPLYQRDLKDDMMYPDPCIEPTRSEGIKVHEFIYEGEKYYYDDKLQIIKFDPKVNEYVYLNLSDPIYYLLHQEVEKLAAKK